MTSSIFKVETVEHLNFLGHGLIANSLLYCGIEMGLFDALGRGPKSTQQLEKELNLDTRATRALLSPLAAMGLWKGMRAYGRIRQSQLNTSYKEMPPIWERISQKLYMRGRTRGWAISWMY